MAFCHTCRFYRFKAATGTTDAPSEEWGVCDNEERDARTKVIHAYWRHRLLRAVPGLDQKDLQEIERETDIRVRGDFGCIFHEGEEIL